MTDFTKVIPPGSEGKIVASVNLAHIKGSIEKSITVKTNDSEHSEFRLTIKANVKTFVDLAPSDSMRFSVSKGETQTQQLTLAPNYTQRIRLMNPVSDADWLTLALTPAGPDDDKEKRYTLKATLNDTAKIGTQNAVIKVSAEGSPEKEISIPVVAVIRGPISINPPMLSFVLRSYPEEVAVTKTVNLRQRAQTTSPVVLELPPGMALRVINQVPDWYQVVTQPAAAGDTSNPLANRVGWVSKGLVMVSKETQEPASQTVVLQKTNGGVFKVLHYAGVPEIKVELEPGNDGKSYTFRVSLANVEKKAGTIPGNILVKTDDPDQPTLTIPVYLIVS